MSTVATGACGYNKHTVKHLEFVAIRLSNASLGRSILAGGASGKFSPSWLPAAYMVSTLRSLGAIGAAGSHLIHQQLVKVASWASLVLSTATGIPKHSAGPADFSEATTKRSSPLTERGDSSYPRAHQKKKKRGHSGDSHSEDDNDDEHGTNKSKSKRRREAESTRLNLACPFAKKDPVRWRSCYRHELSKISYVKQHLYRVHLQSLYCHRCGRTYERQDDLSEHMRSATPCDVRSFAVPEGLTVEQRQRLSERLSSKLSDEQRWYAVFEIVFPGHPHPETPYVDPDMSEDLSSFRDHIARNGARILVEEYRRVEGTCPSSLETTMQRGLEQISSSWLSLRSPYPVGQPSSSRHLRSQTSSSQVGLAKAVETPADD